MSSHKAENNEQQVAQKSLFKEIFNEIKKETNKRKRYASYLTIGTYCCFFVTGILCTATYYYIDSKKSSKELIQIENYVKDD